MNGKELHDKLIAELFDDLQSLSPREIAARNEIADLRRRLEGNEGENQQAGGKLPSRKKAA